jgi:hypothetical protein
MVFHFWVSRSQIYNEATLGNNAAFRTAVQTSLQARLNSALSIQVQVRACFA